jgi:hypothetical protein
LPWLRRVTLFAAVVTHIATISVTGAPCGSDFTIASTVVNTRVPPAAAANGTAGRAWSVVEEGCIGGKSAGLFASSEPLTELTIYGADFRCKAYENCFLARSAPSGVWSDWVP